MKIELQKVDAYILQTGKGPVMFEMVSSWNGLLELKDKDGRGLIVVPAVQKGAYEQLFGEAFGKARSKEEGTSMLVISGSADLIDELIVPK